MKIVDVICSAGRTGFYFDDQRAIKRGAGHDGVFYVGEPVTEGFTAVRQAGEAISVMLLLEDGQIAMGDCAAVQYSGAGGRDPLFLARDFIPVIEQYIKPELVGKEADDFRGLCAMMEAIQVEGKRLHTAIRYGVSQAILDAVAKATGRMMCEVVADEYGCSVSEKPIAIFTQSGDDRYNNADKMIIKGADVLPHALINNVKDKLGENGEKLAEYVAWLRDRILRQDYFGRVGNGGLSLRRVGSMISACERYADRAQEFKENKGIVFNEDWFWALVPKEFKYPSFDKALEFSFDSHPDLCYKLAEGRLPFGCHGWFKRRNIEFWSPLIER